MANHKKIANRNFDDTARRRSSESAGKGGRARIARDAHARNKAAKIADKREELKSQKEDTEE